MSLGRQRFSIIPAAAVTDANLEPRDVQLLCLLGRHTDNGGWCCRSQVKMAKELRCGRSTVQRSISRLVAAGYVEQRPNVRESGADAAHDYRVVIDPPDPCPPVGRGAHPDGQGVPTQMGRGCPPERAPMLTTLVKRNERERARDEEFELAIRAWPSGFADSRDDAQTAWDKLAPEERREAVAEIDRFVNTTKAIGRKHFCGLAAYLREKRWMALPERPSSTPSSTSSGPPKEPPKAPKPAFLQQWEREHAPERQP